MELVDSPHVSMVAYNEMMRGLILAPTMSRKFDLLLVVICVFILLFNFVANGVNQSILVLF